MDDPDETHVLEIDIPAGWSVAGANGWTDQGGGVFSKDVTVDAAAAGEATEFIVDGPILQPPLNGDTNLADLTVRAVSTEVPDDLEGANAGANQKTASDSAAVVIDAEAGVPTATVTGEVAEDTQGAPVLTVSFTDVDDPQETQTLEIDIPAGWLVVDTQGWTLESGETYSKDVSAEAGAAGNGVLFDVDGPLLQPPADDDTDGALTVRAFTKDIPTDGEGSDSALNQRTIVDNGTFTVDAESGVPTVSVVGGEIIEDGTFTPQVTASFTELSDANETQFLEIDIPDGWTVAGLNGWVLKAGDTYSRDVSGEADLAGNGVDFLVDGPILQSPANDDADVQITVRAIATDIAIDGEGTDTAPTQQVATDIAGVVVDAEAGTPVVSVADDVIDEDAPLTPQITVSFTEVADPDETQTLEIDIPRRLDSSRCQRLDGCGKRCIHH